VSSFYHSCIDNEDQRIVLVEAFVYGSVERILGLSRLEYYAFCEIVQYYFFPYVAL
jgi:hypothetical protein